MNPRKMNFATSKIIFLMIKCTLSKVKYYQYFSYNLKTNFSILWYQNNAFLLSIFQEYIVDAKNFSQTDVNEGRVLYEHRRPFSNLTAFDVISLEAMADYAQRSLDLVLNIRISVTAAMIPGGGIDRFIGNK